MGQSGYNSSPSPGLVESWEPRLCRFEEDGGSSSLSYPQRNADDTSTRIKITHIERFGFGIIGSVCSVAYGTWLQQPAALLVMQFNFRANEGYRRYKSAEISIRFEPRTLDHAHPHVRLFHPESGLAATSSSLVRQSPTSTSTSGPAHYMEPSSWPVDEFSIRGQKWSDHDQQEPHEVIWRLREVVGSESGICKPIKLAAIVTFSGSFQATVDVKATTGLTLKVRNYPWSRDDPLLFDGVRTKGRPPQTSEWTQLSEPELADYVFNACSSLGTTLALDETIAVQDEKETQPNAKDVPSAFKTVFRVRGIPIFCNQALFKRSLSRATSIDEHSIHIRSFSPNPYREQKMAIVSFDECPKELEATRPKKEWHIPVSLPISDGGSVELVFDSHFLGFSELRLESSDLLGDTIDIIAIPGLGGHAYGSFKERSGNHMWLEELRSDLSQFQRAPTGVQARVLIYGYNTSVQQHGNSFQSLHDLALSLNSSLRAIRPRDICKRPVVFIGHSLGGLLVKELLILLGKEGDETDCSNFRATAGALFFGVPNRGMDNSALLAILGAQPNRKFLASLTTGSAELMQQATIFPETFNFRDSLIFSFYERCLSGTAKIEDGHVTMNGKPTELVDKDSATHSRPWEMGTNFIIPINRNHSDLVKFERLSDDYEIVLDRLREVAKISTRAVRSRFEMQV